MYNRPGGKDYCRKIATYIYIYAIMWSLSDVIDCPHERDILQLIYYYVNCGLVYSKVLVMPKYQKLN